MSTGALSASSRKRVSVAAMSMRALASAFLDSSRRSRVSRRAEATSTVATADTAYWIRNPLREMFEAMMLVLK